MTILMIESNPLAKTNPNFAIPYPTYFHPSSDDEVFHWQNKLRKMKKQYLYSFTGEKKCDNPTYVIEIFQRSKFCLQPSEDEVKDGRGNIEKTLSRISEKELTAMREEVVRLIPRIIYANPMSRLETLEDAFDIAIGGVLDRVEKIRQEMEGGKSTEF
ncbi:hypothetical protein ACSBR1_012993 [Camellia fascicularis]